MEFCRPFLESSAIFFFLFYFFKLETNDLGKQIMMDMTDKVFGSMKFRCLQFSLN